MNKEKEMFEELTFIPHRNSRSAISAKKEFDNGCLISVVTGEGLYGVLDKVIKTSSRIAITISEKI